MCFGLLQFAPGSRDLSQDEKKIIVVKDDPIHKIIFTQNDNFEQGEEINWKNGKKMIQVIFHE
jgi:hypothetical protein